MDVLAGYGVKGATLDTVEWIFANYPANWANLCEHRHGMGHVYSLEPGHQPSEFTIEGATAVDLDGTALRLRATYKIEKSSGWRLKRSWAVIDANSPTNPHMHDHQWCRSRFYNLNQARKMDPGELGQWILDSEGDRLRKLVALNDERMEHELAHNAWKEDWRKRYEDV